MKIVLKIQILIMIVLIACMNLSLNAQTLTAKEIVQKSDDKARGTTSEGEMTMTVIRPEWSRSISLKSWSKGLDYSLVLITAPAKDKGQVFLKRKTEMWNFMPSIDKLIKLPPSMLGQSWMGSDFTNDDLVKKSSIVFDYDQKLLSKEKEREQDCYKIELIAKPDAAVVWGKIIMWITVNGYNQWKAEYYDEDMKLINVQNSYNIKHMGDRDIPTRLEIEPQDKKGNKTILEINKMVFNKPVNEDFFSQQNMKKIK